MKNDRVLRLCTTALFAALCYIGFTFFQFKVPTPGGFTSFHLGNTFCVLAALFLGGVPGGIAGAIGMGIGDILDPVYITVAPKTIFLKLMIGIISGAVAHNIFHINTLDSKKLIRATIISTASGMIFNIIGEPIFSYFYTSVVLGAPAEAAKKLAAWNAITTSVNAVIAVIISTVLYLAIRPRLYKSGLLHRLSK